MIDCAAVDEEGILWAEETAAFELGFLGRLRCLLEEDDRLLVGAFGTIEEDSGARTKGMDEGAETE